MKVTITSIELKSIKKVIRFFKLNQKITNQLKNTNYLNFKASGFWKKYYTMTLWKSEEDMILFARNGAHLEAMKMSRNIARDVKTLTIEADKLPTWSEAKTLLSKL